MVNYVQALLLTVTHDKAKRYSISQFSYIRFKL